MFRYVAPVILVGVSIAGFFLYTKPLFNDITIIKQEMISYNEALDNAKALENERDKLTKKYNSIDTNNLEKLQKLLPDGIDNIRLILEMEKIAAPYGMKLKDVKYDATEKKDKNAKNDGTKIISDTAGGAKSYGVWNLGFSTEGSYANFNNFIKDIENNLRIVDISSIGFSSEITPGLGKSKSSDVYQYTFNFKTYWLKN